MMRDRRHPVRQVTPPLHGRGRGRGSERKWVQIPFRDEDADGEPESSPVPERTVIPVYPADATERSAPDDHIGGMFQ